MMRTKTLFSLLLTAIFLAAQVASVGAAPATQDTNITGTVVDIVLDTDSNTGITTVLVTLNDGSDTTQTVRLSLEDATTLGLLIDDVPVNPDDIEDPIIIEPDMVIPDEPDETVDEAQHPVGSALSDFFTDLLGVDYDLIMEYHADGVGFGVIAQALWMTNALNNEESEIELTSEDLFKAILDAKQNKDFGELGITLPDGSTPTNWGQFRKAVMSDRDKAKENLGAIMSGRAEDAQDEELSVPKNNGQGQDKDKEIEKKNDSNNSQAQNQNKDKDKNKDNNNSNNGQGQNKDKDKGNDKNNDKGNNKNK